MKLKALDLFCCAGGASLGLHQAGFEVTGVDIDPQPHYPFNFIQADALVVDLSGYDFIWASPPCQQYSTSAMQFRLNGKEYPDLIAATRDRLIETGLPYIIENVPNAPLLNPVMLCGAMFGLRTYRHRLFESNYKLITPEHPPHIAKNTKMGRKPKDGEFIQYVGHFSGVSLVKEMTGCFHMNQYELAQSIPPHYSKYLVEQLLDKIITYKRQRISRRSRFINIGEPLCNTET